MGNGALKKVLDYLLEHSSTIKTKKGALILLETLWPVVQCMGELFVAERPSGKGGIPGYGDVFPCGAIQYNSNDSTDHYVPFHLMSQWLVYSLIEPMERLLGATIEGTELLTPLANFRNGKVYIYIYIYISRLESKADLMCIGGLLMDTGFISLKPKEHDRGIESYHKNSLLPGQPKIEVAPLFEMDDPVVVEWRALTTAYLDIVAERVRDALRLNRNKLSLTRLMDGATWSVSFVYLLLDIFIELIPSSLGRPWACRDLSPQHSGTTYHCQGKRCNLGHVTQG